MLLLSISCATVTAGETDSLVIRQLFDEALSSREAYENLRWLCKKTEGRISGTPEAAAAVEFTRQVMLDMDLDSVYLQELKVRRWIRGEEYARVTSSLYGTEALSITALGMSVGTGERGITGEVIEVHDFEELEALGSRSISGKIVFFNRPMAPTMINTFRAYGDAVDQRTKGASEAAKYGAIAAIIRSVTTAVDDHPHTGVMYYEEGVNKIPAACVSTVGANLLSAWLKGDPLLKVHLISTCMTKPDVTSYNVVGEIRGSEYPDEIITVGGHLDAWDNSEGAHDDGAGCIQSMEVLRLYKELGIQPKRTIRAVMFMDEEIEQRGGKKYAELAKQNNEKHYVALESDRGGFLPRGFGIDAQGERLERIIALKRYFKPYNISQFKRGGGGVDIGPLKQYGTVVISLIPEMQRYFDYHHSPLDTFEQVNIRELQMGSAAIAALLYLIDTYDL